MEQSKLFQLNWADTLKALIMAVLTPAVFLIEQTIETGQLNFDWKKIGVAALAGGVAYLTKNFFSKPSSTSDSPIAK